MATQRAYIRGSGGKFAGANAKGTKVTYGRAGGFANAAFRSRVAASRKAGSPGSGSTAGRKGSNTRFLQRPGVRKAGRIAAATAVGLTVSNATAALGANPVLAVGGGAFIGRQVYRSSTSRAAVKNPAGRKIKR